MAKPSLDELIEWLKQNELNRFEVFDIDADKPVNTCLSFQQLNDKWKVKAEGIKIIYSEIKQLLKNFNSWEIKHVKAHCGIEGNEKADQLANLAISEAS